MKINYSTSSKFFFAGSLFEFNFDRKSLQVKSRSLCCKWKAVDVQIDYSLSSIYKNAGSGKTKHSALSKTKIQFSLEKWKNDWIVNHFCKHHWISEWKYIVIYDFLCSNVNLLHKKSPHTTFKIVCSKISTLSFKDCNTIFTILYLYSACSIFVCFGEY